MQFDSIDIFVIHSGQNYFSDIFTFLAFDNMKTKVSLIIMWGMMALFMAKHAMQNMTAKGENDVEHREEEIQWILISFKQHNRDNLGIEQDYRLLSNLNQGDWVSGCLIRSPEITARTKIVAVLVWSLRQQSELLEMRSNDVSIIFI